ncbi:hypothetical protein RCO28_22875 [Streptomyces sp. LHD-70]|uniref:hypothetical protein n=1 Tax=Streptomyces sp. LHD-70 TaxID=3072140 RepID=UPI00281034EF|nr:hypothetical protein [Streptomyces sp. LHD-70]MDQ8705315.1 hypothetical protein [Streptomyces sp. LHD-70]
MTATAEGAAAPAENPIEAHVADLAAALHGPARAKSRMLAEFREGLIDAARDLSDASETGRAADVRAARQAVREFGAVAELAPDFQRELTVAQARFTARTVMLVAPLLLMCWYLLRWWPGAGGASAPGAARVLIAHLGGVAAVTALLAAAALVATGALARRLPMPRRLPLTVAWSGTAAAAALAVSGLTLVAASVLASNWPLCAAAGGVVLVFHAKIAGAARACRECARVWG